MAANFTKIFFIKIVTGGFCCLLFSAGQTLAQTAFTNNAYLRAETKRIRREAAHIKTDYQESHLNPHKASYKKGRSVRKRAKANLANNPADANNNASNVAPVEFTHKRKARRKTNQ